MKQRDSRVHQVIAPRVAFGLLILIVAGIGAFLWFHDTLPPARVDGTWVQDDRGVWMATGQPSGELPAAVRQQQFVINEAKLAYDVAKNSGESLSDGPCLGVIFQDWVADIAHSPRLPVDGMEEHQCAALRNGEATHYIELSPEGEILKIQ